MSNKTIYTPYFYIIQNIQNGMYYAGSKYAKDADPGNLLAEKGYKTSSKIINELIELNGLESFIVRKIKIFKSSNEAYEYETRFLTRVNARNNINFYNLHNNFLNITPVNFKIVMMKLYGVDNASKLEKVKIKKKDTMLREHGVISTFNLPGVQDKIKENNMEKYGVEYLMNSEDFRIKSKETLFKNHGVENPFNLDIARNNRNIAMLNKYGTTCSFGVPECREKALKTMQIRYGVEYASQRPETKEKKRKNQIDKSNRLNVSIIRNYCNKYHIRTLGPGWYLKDNEFLDKKLIEFREIYGELDG